MEKTDVFRLCGGTFFILLLTARKPLLSSREKYAGKRSGLSEPELLYELAKIVKPDIQAPIQSQGKTAKDVTKDFKACKGTGGTLFELGNSSVRAAFDERVHSSYLGLLNAMHAVTDRFLESRTSANKDIYLVKALLELLDSDTVIPDEAEFYITPDGKPLSKKVILNETHEFCFEAFLLGIWHYALCRVNDYKAGQQTFEKWCPSNNRGPRNYTGNLGENSSRKISLTYWVPTEEPTNVDTLVADNIAHKHQENDANEKEKDFPSLTSENESDEIQTGMSNIVDGHSVTISVNLSTQQQDRCEKVTRHTVTVKESTEDVELLNLLLKRIADSRLKQIPKPEEIAPIEDDYVKQLYNAYGEFLHKSFQQKSDLPPLYQCDLEVQRNRFYRAETVRIQGCDALGPNGESEFKILKNDICSDVWETYMDPCIGNGYQRMSAVMKQASTPSTSHSIFMKTGWVQAEEQKGICHMLAGDNILPWVMSK